MKKILRIVIVIVVILLAVVVWLKFGRGGFGLGNGNDNGIGVAELNQTDEKVTEEKNVVIIKVDESTIYIDDEKCDNIENLKDKISKIEAVGNKKTYVYEHEYAIKETADEVSDVLHSLQDTLGISVEFNE